MRPSLVVASIATLIFALWSCTDNAQQRRAEEDRRYRLSKCEIMCGANFERCIKDKYAHAPLACSEHYNECVRGC